MFLDVPFKILLFQVAPGPGPTKTATTCKRRRASVKGADFRVVGCNL